MYQLCFGLYILQLHVLVVMFPGFVSPIDWRTMPLYTTISWQFQMTLFILCHCSPLILIYLAVVEGLELGFCLGTKRSKMFLNADGKKIWPLGKGYLCVPAVNVLGYVEIETYYLPHLVHHEQHLRRESLCTQSLTRWPGLTTLDPNGVCGSHFSLDCGPPCCGKGA